MVSPEVSPDLFARARGHMVDSQVRPNRVSDARILDAMRRLPRERFLPPRLAALAYVDDDVPLGNGRVLVEPMVIARLVQLAAPMPGERALVVAAGPGYGAAVLSACGARVTALEEDPALLGLARSALTAAAPEVNIVSGPLGAGWPSGAPFDVILIEGAVAAIPPALAQQLQHDGGRLVAVIRGDSGVGQAVLAEPTPVGLHAQAIFDCATPPIPSLLPARAFVF
jgi:protein-L-isoaspartate(D-aspartate) O-methyltransferase